MKLLYMLVIALAVVMIVFHLAAGAVTVPSQWIDLKYCGQPPRDASGAIIRNSTAVANFKKQHTCPDTGLSSGACPGWSVDHVIPLADCGCDHPTNMQWLKNSIKSCAGTDCKDRWERKINHCLGE